MPASAVVKNVRTKRATWRAYVPSLLGFNSMKESSEKGENKKTRHRTPFGASGDAFRIKRRLAAPRSRGRRASDYSGRITGGESRDKSEQSPSGGVNPDRSERSPSDGVNRDRSAQSPSDAVNRDKWAPWPWRSAPTRWPGWP